MLQRASTEICVTATSTSHGTTKTEKFDILCNFSDVCVIFNPSWTAVQCCPFGFAQELDRFAAAFMEMSQSLEQVSNAKQCEKC